MVKSRSSELQFIKSKKNLFFQLKFDNFYSGCIEELQMHFSNIKIPQKILNKKTTFIKTGIFSAIAACWGVILLGTFITFK